MTFGRWARQVSPLRTKSRDFGKTQLPYLRYVLILAIPRFTESILGGWTGMSHRLG